MRTWLPYLSPLWSVAWFIPYTRTSKSIYGLLLIGSRV